jgi:hypothetical protein
VLRNLDADRVDVHAICMAIVYRLSEDDPLLGEVEVVLDSTGVVTGEYGYAEALDQKRRDIRGWMDSPSDRVKKLPTPTLSPWGSVPGASGRAKVTEGIALRKAKYGQF